MATATPQSSSSCPWASTPSRPSPEASTAASMQAIMDETLAQQLYEDECRTVENDWNADQIIDPFVRLQMQQDQRYAELVHANSRAAEDVDDEQEDDGGLAPSSLPSSSLSARKLQAKKLLTASKTATYDRTPVIEGSSSGLNSFREHMRRGAKDAKNGQYGRVESAKRSTHQGVLDERTQLILHKMINNEVMDTIHGGVQTGKEAHVYFAMGRHEETQKERPLAVKIFRTTLNEFSNRHEYVTGDHRFDPHFYKKSARRQIAVWTEKEYRNLCRAARCRLAVPQPVAFKEHVLVMEFIGKDGWPAPTLKDAKLTHAQLQYAYAEVLLALRTLFQEAKLVHGDLSEYNILHHRQRCYIIDFGQAIDETHPECETYLRRDLENVTHFFLQKGLQEAETSGTMDAEDVEVMPMDQALQFVTAADDNTRDAILNAFPTLQRLMEKISSQL